MGETVQKRGEREPLAASRIAALNHGWPLGKAAIEEFVVVANLLWISCCSCKSVGLLIAAVAISFAYKPLRWPTLYVIGSISRQPVLLLEAAIANPSGFWHWWPARYVIVSCGVEPVLPLAAALDNLWCHWLQLWSTFSAIGCSASMHGCIQVNPPQLPTIYW